MSGVGFIPCNVFSQIEKDDDLVETIQVSLLGLHAILTFGISNSPKVIERRRCKPYASAMN
jgi:hypothetical protein